jgi:iron-sulfur cluster insertion protein
MITITENTSTKIAELLKDETEVQGLRVFVQGGGCSGMQYGFAFENEINEDDFIVEQNNVKFIVDAMSMQYLTGSTIDYKEDFSGANFVIQNPNAETTCGCGSSFSA